MNTKKPDAEIGYGNPPVHSRFQPGRSGNPRGRPKGSLNFATDLKKTLESPITLNDGGKPRRVSTQEAMLLRLREKALKGDARALDRLLEFARMFSVGPTEAASRITSVDDQAILDAYRTELLAGEEARQSSRSSDDHDREAPR